MTDEPLPTEPCTKAACGRACAWDDDNAKFCTEGWHEVYGDALFECGCDHHEETQP